MMTTWIRWLTLALALLALGSTLSAEEATSFPFEFSPQPASKALPARLAPSPASVPLKAGGTGLKEGSDHRTGILNVGAPGDTPRRLVVARSKPGEAYDLLLVDLNGDGSLDDEKPIAARMQSSGSTIWSNFKIMLRVNHAKAGKPHVVHHELKGYIAVYSKDAKAETFNYTSQGHLSGTVKVDSKEYEVVLSDRNNDARYGKGDVWIARAIDGSDAGHATNLGEAAKIGGRMLFLLLADTGAASPRLGDHGAAAAAPAAGGVAGDIAKEHPDDAKLPRAQTPLPFADGVDAAMAAALKVQGPVFLSFESESTKDTHALRGLVFTAKAVVDTATGLSSARIDIDLDKASAQRFKIKQAPTGVLLDPEGKEVARYTGYQSIPAMRAFLSNVHPWLMPADDEPKLKGKASKRHKAIVKKHIAYLQDNKSQGLLVDRIKDLGGRRNRGARDALIKFAGARKSKQYVAGAFHALAKIGGRIGIEFLCGPKALGSKDFLVAQEAAMALGEAKDEAAVSAILAVLYKKGTKIEVVSACCIALAKSSPKDERVIKAVFEHSSHGKDTIRAGAAEALGYIASDDAVGRMKVLLESDENGRVRGAAATGMGHSRRPELIPVLRKAIANDNAHQVRTAAHEAIQKLQDPDAK